MRTFPLFLGMLTSLSVEYEDYTVVICLFGVSFCCVEGDRWNGRNGWMAMMCASSCSGFKWWDVLW
jgi:hypothetical protein